MSIADNLESAALKALENAQLNLSSQNKLSFITTISCHAQASGDQSQSGQSHTIIDCEVDRTKRIAHLLIKEGHAHTSQVTQIYYYNDLQYINTGNGWQKNKAPKEALGNLFNASNRIGLTSLNLLRDRGCDLKHSENTSGEITLTGSITGSEVAKVAASASGNSITAANLDKADYEVDIDPHSGWLNAFRLNATSGGAINSNQTIEVKVRKLNDDFEIKLPSVVTVSQALPGIQELSLNSQEAVASCWCTGCAACAACLACAACISCVACVFPPLLAPVTATAAGTAISVAVGVSVSASVGIATAIQKGG